MRAFYHVSSRLWLAAHIRKLYVEATVFLDNPFPCVGVVNDVVSFWCSHQHVACSSLVRVVRPKYFFRGESLSTVFEWWDYTLSWWRVGIVLVCDCSWFISLKISINWQWLSFSTGPSWELTSWSFSHENYFLTSTIFHAVWLFHSGCYVSPGFLSCFCWCSSLFFSDTYLLVSFNLHFLSFIRVPVQTHSPCICSVFFLFTFTCC